MLKEVFTDNKQFIELAESRKMDIHQLNQSLTAMGLSTTMNRVGNSDELFITDPNKPQNQLIATVKPDGYVYTKKAGTPWVRLGLLGLGAIYLILEFFKWKYTKDSTITNRILKGLTAG